MYKHLLGSNKKNVTANNFCALILNFKHYFSTEIERYLSTFFAMFWVRLAIVLAQSGLKYFRSRPYDFVVNWLTSKVQVQISSAL